MPFTLNVSVSARAAMPPPVSNRKLTVSPRSSAYTVTRNRELPA